MHATESGPPDPFPESDSLIACPTCDLLYRTVVVPTGGRLRCRRCRTILMTNRAGAEDRILASAFGSVILAIAAIFFPFLQLTAAGLQSSSSVLDAVLAFDDPRMLPLAFAVGLAILVLPILRACLLAYTLLPLRMGRPPAPAAASAFRWASLLKPWSMAEIFLIGVVVALVKMTGLASVHLGLAFWAMAVLVMIVILERANLCEWTIWQKLERSRQP